jgi:hypothetical protein
MSDESDTPESMEEPELEGVDPDDLAGLDVDSDDLDEDADSDTAQDADLDDSDIDDQKTPARKVAGADEERLNLDDEDDVKPRKRKTEEDENEFASADDEEADLATILQEKLRSGDDLPPDEEGDVVDLEDVTDGTPLLQPRRPDEEHCQQCFLLVRKSAPKCPVDHDMCPLFPSA